MRKSIMLFAFSLFLLFSMQVLAVDWDKELADAYKARHLGKQLTPGQQQLIKEDQAKVDPNPADVRLLESALKAIDEGRPLNPEMREAVLNYWRTAPRDGDDELDRSGGPDDFGYMFSDQDEDNGPDFEWIEMTNDATDVSAELGDDNTSQQHEIGFDFPFYGETYDSYWIQSNGSIAFYSNYMSLSNYALPTTSYGAMICWFWDDMHRRSAEVLIETMDINGSRAHLVTATNYGEFGGNGLFDWQVAMFESGKILMQYRDVTVDRSSCTVGIQNEGGTIGLQYCYNNTNNAPDDQTAIVFFTGSAMSGIVTNASTGMPVEGANIDLYNAENDELFAETTSDGNGYYSIDQIEEGMYYAEVTKEMYVDLLVTDIEANPPEPIEQNFAIIPFMEVNLEELQMEVQPDTWVDISGIVTQPTNSTTSELTSFYIQDQTGYGVQVFSAEPWDPENDLNRGDEIRVVGRVDEIDGVTAITDIYLYEVLSVDNPMPEPLDLGTGATAALIEMEGTWIHIHGYLQDDPGEGTFMVRIDDDTGPCWVKIMENTGIDAMEGYSSGDWFYINGVVSIYEGIVMIIPSLPEDIWRTAMYAPGHFIAFLTDSTEGIVDLEWGLYDPEGGELDGFLEFVIYLDGDEIHRTRSLSYTDTLVVPEEPGTYTYLYGATTVYHEGETDPSTFEVELIVEDTTTAISDNQAMDIPREWAIASAHPNPFNSEVKVTVAVPRQVDVAVQVFDLLGRQVANLHQGRLQPGYHPFNWKATGPSGVYFLKVNSGDGWHSIRKLVYIR